MVVASGALSKRVHCPSYVGRWCMLWCMLCLWVGGALLARRCAVLERVGGTSWEGVLCCVLALPVLALYLLCTSLLLP